MDWLNVHTSVINSPEFSGAQPVDRATWLCLSHYCCRLENSGIIDNCATWTNRNWQERCRVSKKETLRKSALWDWMDGSLIVKHYSIENQNKAQSNRVNGKGGGRPKKTQEEPCGYLPDNHVVKNGIYGREREIEKERERGKEDTPTLSPLVDISKPEDRYRSLLERHGCVLEQDGKDLFPQWQSALARRVVSWAEYLFREKKIRPAWPSEFRKILKERDGEYEYWNHTRTKETERISKESA
jgi:hypothetical protein